MTEKQDRQGTLTRLACGLELLVCLGVTGCQVDVGGQTLPSGYYLWDDVQYYAPGPEFLLSREAAVQREFRGKQIAPAPPEQVQP